MCGAEKLVPSRIAYWSPANSGSVDERICAPGPMTSGFSACPNGVSPPAEKLVGTPAHVVGTSLISRENRTVTAPPFPAAAARIRAPSRSEMVPPGSPEKSANVGSPGRFSATTMPMAPASRTRASFALYGQPPRLTSAIEFRSEPAASEPSQSCRFAPPIVPTSTSRWSVEIHEGGMLSAGPKGIRATPPGARHRDRRAEDVRVRGRADADGVRRGCGRARRPEPEEVAIVSGRDDRHDARANDVRDGLDEHVRPRIRLRPTAREVDDVHPVAYGCLEGGDDLGAVRRAAAAERRRSRDVEDAVVADVRAGRDAFEVVDCGMAAALRLDADARPRRPRRRS